MSGLYGPPDPNPARAEAEKAGVEEDIQRADHKRQQHYAIEELRAGGKLKRPWHQRLFRRSHPTQ